MTEETNKGAENKVHTEQSQQVKSEKDILDFATPDQDFDWGAFEEDAHDVKSPQKGELAQKYDETLSTISENEVIDGTVVSMNKREVVINIGYKSEGV
ncbi:MAG: hypothetical protein R6U66_01805, partial [Bacteroidales bacterium]